MNKSRHYGLICKYKVSIRMCDRTMMLNLLLSDTLPNLKNEIINALAVNIIKSHVPNVILNKKNVDVK
jgi:hypothetical protein